MIPRRYVPEWQLDMANRRCIVEVSDTHQSCSSNGIQVAMSVEL